jgi:4-hydroxy-tetrahydrodipicolinate reductase
MTKLVVVGPMGRMGSAIIRELGQSGTEMLAAALCRGGSDAVGKNAGAVVGIQNAGGPVVDGLDGIEFDVMIDFSAPDAVGKHIEMCTAHKAGIVIGTTGLDESQNSEISDAARQIPVLYAANTSIGINLCVALVELAARVLGSTTDIEVVEAHHRHKADAPSGTALLLGETAAAAVGTSLDQSGVFAREGNTGERQPGTIGFSVVRGGNIAGEHSVMFIGENERIEITHRAADRKIFAQGAIRAAQWLSNREPGLYSMQDVLDLH